MYKTALLCYSHNFLFYCDHSILDAFRTTFDTLWVGFGGWKREQLFQERHFISYRACKQFLVTALFVPSILPPIPPSYQETSSTNLRQTEYQPFSSPHFQFVLNSSPGVCCRNTGYANRSRISADAFDTWKAEHGLMCCSQNILI